MAELCSTSKGSTRIVKGLHRFTLEKYSLCKGVGCGRPIYSSGFTVGGHRWALNFYPDGPPYRLREIDPEKYIGLFIRLLSESNGVRCLYKITLLDQSGQGNHLTMSLFDNSSEPVKPAITNRGSGFPYFIRKDELEKSSYLKYDCLKFECTLHVHETETIRVPICDDVGIDFITLLETGRFSDVIFDVSGKKFRAHKVILSSRSSVFQSVFASQLDSNHPEIVITGVEPRVFKALLHFCYTDKLPENEESFVCGYAFGSSVSSTLAAKLLAAAHAYDMTHLKSICESHLWRSISLYRFAETMIVADVHNAHSLKHLCFEYASHCYAALKELGSFTYLQNNYLFLFDELSDYLSKENLLLKEDSPFTGKRRAWLYSAKEMQLLKHASPLRPISKLVDDVLESASQTVRIMQRGSHEFVVENYSLCEGIGVNKAIENGKDVDVNKNGYTSITVCLKSETSTPLRYLLEIYILDQSGKGNHHGYSLFKYRHKQATASRRGHMFRCLHFIKRASLENSTYLREDCLKIHCTIGVFTNDIQDLPVIDVPVSTMSIDLGNLFESKQGADVFFLVANERVCAHKYILATRSPWLWSFFSDQHQEQDNEMVIPDVEPKVFKAMLWFIYTGKFLEEEPETSIDSGSFILTSFLGKMLAAADQFELKNLKKICESRILERLSVESIGYTLHLADLYHATELKAACLRFAAKNKAAFMESEGSEYLKETWPLLFLEVIDYEENPMVKRGWDILVDMKEYIVGWYWHWSTDSSEQKGKHL